MPSMSGIRLRIFLLLPFFILSNANRAIVPHGFAAPRMAFRGQQVTTTPEKWREDLQFLAAELPRRHINAFHATSAEAWYEQVAALDAAIPSLPDHVILTRLTRLVALIGDAHTSIGFNSTLYPIRRYPLSLTNRPDGIYLTAVSAESIQTPRGPMDYSRALGSRLIAIGGVDIEEAKRRMTTLISTDNDIWPTFVLPSFLIIPEFLHALEIVPDMEQGAYLVEDATGQRREVVLKPGILSLPAFVWPGVRRWTMPLVFSRPSTLNYWYEYLEDKRTVYFRYRRCQEQSDLPFSVFSAELLNLIDTRNVDRLIIELRDNTGGNSAILDPFIEAIRNRPWLNQTGRLFVLINRGTASSAMLNANTFDLRTNAILVGEPTGGKPTSYGEVRTFLLPHSGLTVNYSTKFFRLRQDDPPGLLPNLFVEYPWSAFEAGRDPVFEAALHY